MVCLLAKQINYAAWKYQWSIQATWLTSIFKYGMHWATDVYRVVQSLWTLNFTLIVLYIGVFLLIVQWIKRAVILPFYWVVVMVIDQRRLGLGKYTIDVLDRSSYSLIPSETTKNVQHRRGHCGAIIHQNLLIYMRNANVQERCQI